jgi:hypothetical protein
MFPCTAKNRQSNDNGALSPTRKAAVVAVTAAGLTAAYSGGAIFARSEATITVKILPPKPFMVCPPKADNCGCEAATIGREDTYPGGR